MDYVPTSLPRLLYTRQYRGYVSIGYEAEPRYKIEPNGGSAAPALYLFALNLSAFTHADRTNFQTEILRSFLGLDRRSLLALAVRIIFLYHSYGLLSAKFMLA